MVFGCVTFAQDLSPNLDKLSPRSVKCVFVDTLTHNKGFVVLIHPLVSILYLQMSLFSSLNVTLRIVFLVRVHFPSPVEPCESTTKDLVTVEQEETRPLKVYCRC